MSEPDNKRKKPNYYLQRKRKQYVLEPGLKGFLCTCNFREKECVRESYNILNMYADANKAEEATPETKEDTSDNEDISEELSKELNSMKAEKPAHRRFQVVESGAKNMLFIRTTMEDPVGLVNSIIQDIVSAKQQKTRFLLRLVPIEITCKANLADIKLSVNILIDKYFSGEPKSFAIIFNHRNNNQLNRDEVIKEVASLVSAKNTDHKVDLKNADLSILIEIIRGICLIGVIPDYFKYKKYNLLQLAEGVDKNSDENEKLCENSETESKDGENKE